MKFVAILSFAFFLAGCGSLDKKALLVNSGDSKEEVTSVMVVNLRGTMKHGNIAKQAQVLDIMIIELFGSIKGRFRELIHIKVHVLLLHV